MMNIPIHMNQKTSSYCTKTVAVDVSGPTYLNYKGQKTGFKCYVHRFIRRFTSSVNGTGKCELTLYNSHVTTNGKSLHLTNTIPEVSFYGIVFVYFYGNDPRPLLACYKGKTYIPKGKDEYGSQWEKVEGIQKCVCDDKGDNEAILKELVRVVGFLNEVDLSKHPTGTRTNGECTNTCSPGTANACTPTEKNGTCNYEVHKYKGRDVKVRVECDALNGNKSGNGSCYKKLTHTPAGLNGQGDVDGYRLGNVVYNRDGRFKQGSVPYYENVPTSKGVGTTNNNGDYKSDNWCKPLVKVEAYFYNEDTKYKDPLLVELEFANRDSSGAKEYYKLIMTSELADTMRWEKDTGVSIQMSTDPSKYLDGIRYKLKQVLKVEIASQSKYDLKVSQNPRDTLNWFSSLPKTNGDTVNSTDDTSVSNNGFKSLNLKQIQVEVFEYVCAKLNSEGYKCFLHKITKIENQTDIAGLKFYIPSKLPKNDTSSEDNGNEVTLYNLDKSVELAKGVQKTTGNQNTYKEYEHIYYNKCMGDVYVYFYNDDPRPGLLCFNDTVYKPNKLPEQGTDGKYDYSSEEYRRWYNVKGIRSCLCTYDGDEETFVQLLTELYFGSRFVKFFSEHWVELSSGTGTGVVGLSSIGGGGYLVNAYFSFIKWFV